MPERRSQRIGLVKSHVPQRWVVRIGDHMVGEIIKNPHDAYQFNSHDGRSMRASQNLRTLKQEIREWWAARQAAA